MRMALATVSGFSTTRLWKIGAEPAAWKPSHLRALRGFAEAVKLFVAHPVGADVAGVADGQDVDVGRVAEHFDDLEAGGLLALKAIRD